MSRPRAPDVVHLVRDADVIAAAAIEKEGTSYRLVETTQNTCIPKYVPTSRIPQELSYSHGHTSSDLLYSPPEMQDVVPDGFCHLPFASVHISQGLCPNLGVGHGQIYRVSCLDMPREHDGCQCGQIRPRIGIVYTRRAAELATIVMVAGVDDLRIGNSLEPGLSC